MPRSDKTSVPDSTAAASTGSRSSKLNKLKFGSLASTFKGAFTGSKKLETESSIPDQKLPDQKFQAAADRFLTMAAESRVTANETHDGGQSAIGPDTTISHAKTSTVTQPPIEEDDMAIGPAPPRY